MLRPHPIAVSEADLADLHHRLDSARWPDPLPNTGWSLGMDHDVLRAVVDRWRHGFDWRVHEAWLNRYPSYVHEVGEDRLHVIHARSSVAGALPLVLLHGWPSAVSEFRRVVGPLLDPVAHGGEASDAFDVVLVSLPGFGWSGPTRTVGWDANRMADGVSRAMTALDIERFGVFGTDAGAYVATALASFDAARVVGLHLQLGGVAMTQRARAAHTVDDDLTDVERQAFVDVERYEKLDSGYALLNGTKPLTLGFALTDSPVGQAAWILEKFHTWTGADDRDAGAPFGEIAVDDVLAIVSTYWFTRTAGSAARFYADAGVTLARDGLPRVDRPTGCAVFPADIVRPSRRWAERSYPNIVQWTEMACGGHFGALEVPDLLVADLRMFFRGLR